MDFDYVVIPAALLVVGFLVIWLSLRRMRALSTKHYSTGRKVAERIVLSCVVLAVAAVAGSSVWNAVALHRFWARNPPRGEVLLVGGHRMHIDCTGSGSPTVVLDAGLGADALTWGAVQPVLAKTTRVCSYDRAGFGWSEALPAPRDANHIAGELHQLLLEARVAGPVVLMGHSITGIYMRDYATRYPSEVAGMVFVDGSTPLQDENPAMKSTDSPGPPPWVLRAALIAGVPRLLGMCSKRSKSFAPDAGKLLAEDVCRVHFGAMTAELDSLNQSGRQTVHSGPYGALPILIFSHDPAKLISQHNAPRGTAERQNAWSQMQKGLKQLSTRSRRIVARGSTHNIHHDRAELVEREVSLLVEQIRGTAPPPADFGSTITE